MKKIVLVLISFVLLLSTASCSSQPSTYNITGLLSEVSYEGGKAYIFGSNHYGKADYYPLHKTIRNAMDRSAVFVFETADFETAPTELPRIPNGGTLETYLPAEIFDGFVKTVEAMSGLAYESFQYDLPSVIAFTMLQSKVYEGLAYQYNLGIDYRFKYESLARKKQQLGLNTLESEYEILLDLPYDAQVELAQTYALNDPTALLEAEVQAILDVADAYEKTDVEKLTALLVDTKKDAAEQSAFGQYMYEQLVLARNQIFADKIEELLQAGGNQTYFITMGIGHLLGDSNVYTLLQEKGFTVTPVEMQ